MTQGSETSKLAESFRRQVTERDGGVTVMSSENKDKVTVADSETATLEQLFGGIEEQQGGSPDTQSENDSEL